ncbi:protein O-glucosyltransferase 1 [Eucalyptus grandis]|nr:protein O-glucosyltransferase 1 [Eucalyptus grandis]
MEEEKLHGLPSSKRTPRSLKVPASAAVFVLFLIIVLSGCIISGLDIFIFPGGSLREVFNVNKIPEDSLRSSQKIEYLLNCTNATKPQTCPIDYLTMFQPTDLPARECPEYFRWIHEDLRAWKSTGITKEMVERTRDFAHYRLVILKGRVYVEHFRKPYQTRDVGTIWGIVQLLRLYPGKIPDLELMFYCNDQPVIMKNDYQGPNATLPPPLFRFCGNQSAFDITFPDWSFWGWAEINIGPWESTVRAIRQNSEKIEWNDKVPYAYWKGNTGVAATRRDLMKCNATSGQDWKTHLYHQEWSREVSQGFKQSKLEDQCTHRYKIYVEGEAWSVSEKYIMACNSMTLMVKPEFLDFFTRGMIPLEHYWPIRPDNKCRDIKFAVEWGNNHPQEAQVIGESGSKFMEEGLKMKNVYDYMFHLLSGYGKLITYKPEIPPGAIEYCSETMACPAQGLFRKNMLESMVKSPSDSPPCTLPPPYEPGEFQAFLGRKESVSRQVERWEAEYWEKMNKN